jgi:REP element-mobilizing transposase RayT
MNFSPDNVYHIFNQGNNQQQVFSCDEEYEIFLTLVRENIFAHSEIISWCLMPNHFHFMVYTERVLNINKQGGLQIDVLTNGIRKLLSGLLFESIIHDIRNDNGDLHTKSYANILEGKGFPLMETRRAIELVYRIRNC